MIKIALLDKRKLLRVSLESLISSFSNCETIVSTHAVNVLCSSKADIDLIIVDPNSLQSASEKWYEDLLLHYPNSAILILTDALSPDKILKAAERQIYAYFSKYDCPLEIERVIKAVPLKIFQTETYFGEKVKQYLVQQNQNQKKQHNRGIRMALSKREAEILALICREKTNAEISEILNLSVRTVEAHRRRMIEKTDSRSIIGVILSAVNNNVLTAEFSVR